MLDFLARPLRSVLGVAEHEVTSPLQGTEHDLVVLLAPLAKAEHGVETIEHLVHLHRRAAPEGAEPAGS